MKQLKFFKLRINLQLPHDFLITKNDTNWSSTISIAYLYRSLEISWVHICSSKINGHCSAKADDVKMVIYNSRWSVRSSGLRWFLSIWKGRVTACRQHLPSCCLTSHRLGSDAVRQPAIAVRSPVLLASTVSQGRIRFPIWQESLVPIV